MRFSKTKVIVWSSLIILINLIIWLILPWLNFNGNTPFVDYMPRLILTLFTLALAIAIIFLKLIRVKKIRATRSKLT